jgi:flagellar hook-associated protein 3 FlgL
VAAVDYVGARSTTDVRVGPRQSAGVNVDGKGIFQNGADLFGIVVSLRDAVRAGDQDAIRDHLAELEGAHANLRTQMGSIGAEIDNLAMVRNASEGFRDLNEQVISDQQDADVAELSMQLNSQMVLMQTVLRLAAQSVPQSLANFL